MCGWQEDVSLEYGPAVEAVYSPAAEPSDLGSEGTPSSSPARSTSSSSDKLFRGQLGPTNELKISAVLSSEYGPAVEAVYSFAAEPWDLGSEGMPSSSPARSTSSSSGKLFRGQLGPTNELKTNAVLTSEYGSAVGGNYGPAAEMAAWWSKGTPSSFPARSTSSSSGKLFCGQLGPTNELKTDDVLSWGYGAAVRSIYGPAAKNLAWGSEGTPSSSPAWSASSSSSKFFHGQLGPTNERKTDAVLSSEYGSAVGGIYGPAAETSARGSRGRPSSSPTQSASSSSDKFFRR